MPDHWVKREMKDSNPQLAGLEAAVLPLHQSPGGRATGFEPAFAWITTRNHYQVGHARSAIEGTRTLDLRRDRAAL